MGITDTDIDNHDNDDNITTTINAYYHYCYYYYDDDELLLLQTIDDIIACPADMFTFSGNRMSKSPPAA